MYKSILTSLILALAACLASCGKGNDGPVPPVAAGKRVLIVCEGMMGSGNAALGLYLPDSNQAREDIYQEINQVPLGDVFQSITRINNSYFLCINNSDRIIVVAADDFRYSGSISLPKPRYILPISPTKAYVSTLFGNEVYIINPQTLAITGTIPMPFMNPEGMLLHEGSAYVCTWDTAASAMYKINTANDSISAAVPVGRAPQEILRDAEGMLWVLSGNKAKGVEAKLSRIDPATGFVLRSYLFGDADPLRPVFNKTRDTLYFIEVSQTGSSANNGVYRMGIHDAVLPAQAFIPANGFQYFWGLGIRPETGHIYVADPVGFTQRGKVYVYRPDGSLVTTFATGVGPGHFLFD